jgi:hypothetical protein
MGGSSYILGNVTLGSSAAASEKLEVIGTASGRILHGQDLLRSSGSLIVESGAYFDGTLFHIAAGPNRVGVLTGTPKASFDVVGSMSGDTVTISSLRGCDTIDTTPQGTLICGSDSGAGAGMNQTDGDLRYVNQSGDGMTGALAIASGNPKPTADANILLEVMGAMSGKSLQITGTGAANRPLIFTDITKGRIAFGSSSIIAGKVQITSSGSTGIYSDNAGGTAVVGSLLLDQTITSAPSTTAFRGFANKTTALFGSDPGAKNILSFYSEAGSPSGSSLAAPTLVFRGSNNVAVHNGSSTLGQLQGLAANVRNNSTGTVGTGASLLSEIINNNASGVISNAFGVLVAKTFGNAGTMTNTYGVYVADITSGTQTNTPYSFYASDGNALNFFAGNVGIGTTNPSTALEVAGTMSGRSLQVTGTGSTALIFTDITQGTVGIGTTSLTSNGRNVKLEVAGTMSGEDIITRGPIVDVRYFGAKGDGRLTTDASTTSGIATVTSATASFKPTDVGKNIGLSAAGPGGTTLQTTIAAYISNTQVDMAVTASNTAGSQVMTFGTNDATNIQRAIDYVGRSGGTVFFPQGNYLLKSGLTINKSQVHLQGVGGYGTFDVGDVRSIQGTKFTWDGTAGSTMLTISPTEGASNQALKRVRVSDISFVGNGMFMAGTGMMVRSTQYFDFSNLYFQNFKYVAIATHVVTTLGEARDTTRGVFRNIGIRQLDSAAASGTGMTLDGQTGANTNNVDFESISIIHQNGHAIELLNGDSNRFYGVTINRASGGRGSGVYLNASATNGLNARGNVFYYIAPGAGGVFSKGRTNFNADRNRFYFYSTENGEPVPYVEPGSNIDYQTDRYSIMSGSLAINKSTGALANTKLEVRGNVLIGSQANATQALALVNSAAGAFGTGVNIDAVYSSAVWNGKLYIGTREINGAGVYRYDGGTTFTRITFASGRIMSTDAADIDAINLTVFAGQLWAGTRTGAAGTAAVYNYDGTNWSMRNPARGTFGAETARDGVWGMAVNQGKLYVTTEEPNASGMYRFDGGTNWVRVNATVGKCNAEATADIDGGPLISFYGYLYWGTVTGANTARLCAWGGSGTSLPQINLTAGAFTTGGPSSLDDVTALAVHEGTLFLGVSEPNLAGIYRYSSTSPTDARGTNVFQKTTLINGRIDQFNDATDVDWVPALKTYNGRLYATSSSQNLAGVYEFKGGGTSSGWLLVNSARGTFGSQTNVDSGATLMDLNGTLYVGTQELNGGGLYSFTKTNINSYSLMFESGTGANYGSISFVGNRQADSNSQGLGSFYINRPLSSTTGAFDYAEDYPTYDLFMGPGDLVAIDPMNPEHIKRAVVGDGYVGIVSERPGFRLSLSIDEQNGAKYFPVALVGRVPIKVSAENGAIKPGDYLTGSKKPGVAVKATKAGLVIGQAMGSFKGPGIGSVVGYLKNVYWPGEP